MRCEGEGVKGEEEREGGRKISKEKATEWDQWVTAQSGIEKRPDDSKETQGEGISQFVTPSSPEETKMEPWLPLKSQAPLWSRCRLND